MPMTIADALPLRTADAVATPVSGAAAPAGDSADFAQALAGMMSAGVAPEGAEGPAVSANASAPETPAPHQILSDLTRLAAPLPGTKNDAPLADLPLAAQPAAALQLQAAATAIPVPLAVQADQETSPATEAEPPLDVCSVQEDATSEGAATEPPTPSPDDPATNATGTPDGPIRPDATAHTESEADEGETSPETPPPNMAAAPVAALPVQPQTNAPARPAPPTSDSVSSVTPSARLATSVAAGPKAAALPSAPTATAAPVAASADPSSATNASPLMPDAAGQVPETTALRPKANPATADIPTEARSAKPEPDTATPSAPVDPEPAPSRLSPDVAAQLQTAAPSQPAPTANPVALNRPGWEGTVTDRILAELSEDGSRIDLDLTPEHLGKLRISLEMVDGRAQIRFITETPEAARLIQQSEHRLSESLSRAGLSLGAQDSSSRDGQTHSQYQQNQQQGDRSARNPAPRQTEALLQRPATLRDGAATLRPAGGRLNLIA